VTRQSFGKTWWGKAWVDALEHRARLDPNRLPRGRTYARTGRVMDLTVGPGEVTAPVHGTRVTPYLVRVRVRMFEPAEWDRLLDAIAAKAAHTAALLDGELPIEVVADAAAVGVELLPGPGEIGPRCSCPDWADPCKHAAAVIYLVAPVLDADPFALLLLRGRTRNDILAGLRQRRAAPSRTRRGDSETEPTTMGRPADLGVEARRAWGQFPTGDPDPVPVPLPAVPLPPRHPGAPAPLAVAPPPWSGLRAPDLSDLAADAARRAWALCAGDGDGGLTLDPELDVIRRAAGLLATPSRRGLEDLALRAGYRPAELGRLAQAWRTGGADAVEVMSDSWSASPEALDEGRMALGPVGAARVWNNRLTVGTTGIQLRLSRAGRWYRFERSGTNWELVAGPETDPTELVGPPVR